MTASARSTRPWLHRISKTKPPIRRRRPRRTLGGLGILLIVMTTLVVVPLAETDDAVGAHTLTEERCDFDTISGAPFNCRDVPVSHTHDTCGHPSQHAHDGRGCHPRTDVHCSSGQHAHEGVAGCHDTGTVHCGNPTQHAHDDRSCHSRNEVHCPSGQHSHVGHTSCHGTGTVHCGSPTQHAHDGRACHARTDVHCPTGQHSHTGHTSCHTTSTVHCGHPSQHAHDGRGCHARTEVHCPSGQHSHSGHVSCHSSGTVHCGQPSQHAHDGRGCHARTEVHCPSGQHSHSGHASCHDTGTVHCGQPSQHAHDGRGCHARTEVHCPSGQHSHSGHASCHDTGTVHCGQPSQHAHDGRGCHARTDVHCPSGQHSHSGHASCHDTGTVHCGQPSQHAHDGRGCHARTDVHCASGQHSHSGHTSCHSTGTVHCGQPSQHSHSGHTSCHPRTQSHDDPDPPPPPCDLTSATPTVSHRHSGGSRSHTECQSHTELACSDQQQTWSPGHGHPQQTIAPCPVVPPPPPCDLTSATPTVSHRHSGGSRSHTDCQSHSEPPCTGEQQSWPPGHGHPEQTIPACPSDPPPPECDVTSATPTVSHRHGGGPRSHTDCRRHAEPPCTDDEQSWPPGHGHPEQTIPACPSDPPPPECDVTSATPTVSHRHGGGPRSHTDCRRHAEPPCTDDEQSWPPGHGHPEQTIPACPSDPPPPECDVTSATPTVSHRHGGGPRSHTDCRRHAEPPCTDDEQSWPPGHGHPEQTIPACPSDPPPPECDVTSATPTVSHRHASIANGAHTDCRVHDTHDCTDAEQTWRPLHGHDPVRIPPCESDDTASHIPNDIEIDGQTISDIVGSTEVTFLCQLAAEIETDSVPNRLRGQRLIEALGEWGLALVCGDGAQSYWYYLLDGDTSPKAFAEFGINVGLEIICGAIAVGTVAATSALTTPLGGALAGTAVAITCSDAAGEVAVWIVEGMDYLIQELNECGNIAPPSPLIPWTPLASAGACLSDAFEPGDETTQQSHARITETPPVCARIDGDWLEVTWDEVSAQSMSRLRGWIVFWSVHMDGGGSIRTRDNLLVTNVRGHRFLKPGWVTGGSLAEADWTVGVIASAGVGGFEPWASQRVAAEGGWSGSNGVGSC